MPILTDADDFSFSVQSLMLILFVCFLGEPPTTSDLAASKESQKYSDHFAQEEFQKT